MQPSPMEQLDLPRARQVDQICDRFERAWCAGARPCVNDYRAEAPAGAEAALRWELGRVESWYRPAGG